jgi:Sulfotransferase family
VQHVNKSKSLSRLIAAGVNACQVVGAPLKLPIDCGGFVRIPTSTNQSKKFDPEMVETRKAILVTGSHRSGSTWVGQILATAPRTAYLHEPFNPRNKTGIMQENFETWFQYICDENSTCFEEALLRVFNYKYPLSGNLARARNVKQIAKIARDQGLSFLHKIGGYTPVVKDPIAIFSANWLSDVFHMNVIVLIRHPAAFTSSIKLKNWKFDFNNFLAQQVLMESYLHDFREEIYDYAKHEKNIIDQAILLWNCIHHTINVYRKNQKKWMFIRHEDISANPISQFRKIYSAFDLDFTAKVNSRILDSSGVHNPVEPQTRNELVRNSKANIQNWKNRLDNREILRIREKTEKVSSIFYEDGEW